MLDSRRAVLALLAVAGIAADGPAPADAQGDLCLSAEKPPITAPAHPLRFGITPQLAGTAGGTQGEVAPEDPAKAVDALHGLQPPRRRLVMRLNRLFMSDGGAGIERFSELAEGYRREGFAVESQVRYHPSPEQEGDMAAWEQFVREATAALAANPALVALTITNEVNLPLSPNTSDGAYEGALDALVRGVVAAHDELAGLGRSDVALGFSYAYRYFPDQDRAFWRGIGQRATAEFYAALDYVGVQLYPGLFWPPFFGPGETAGDATIEALTLVRRCWMPQAGLGDDVEMWITENGYATNLGRRLERQVNDLNSTLEDVCGYSGTLNVPEYRYFNLRDNRSSGGDLFDAVGLLFDDYSQKPAFSAYRDHIESCGQDEVGATDGRRLRLHLRLRCHIDGLRAKVKGRDRNRVRRVRFLARGDRVARDRRPPFSRLLAADELGRTPRWRVRARARVDDGLRTRLKRSVRRCR